MKELPPAGERIRDLVQAINQLIRGRSNAAFSATLRTGQTTTIIQNANINGDARAIISAASGPAAAEIASTHAVVTAPGVVTITHLNNAVANRTFSVLVIGG